MKNHRNQLTSRVLAWVLSFLMVFQMMPTAVFAEAIQTNAEQAE